MNPPKEADVATSVDFGHWRLPLRRLWRDVLCRARVAAEPTLRGSRQVLDLKLLGQTIPAVLAGRGAC